jgi:hypothetical protein
LKPTPNTLDSIDPGKNACALAEFSQGTLIAAVETLVWLWGPGGPRTIVVEVPVPDRAHPQRSKDLIDEYGAGRDLAGQIRAYCPGSELVLRHARGVKGEAGWKGQIVKPLHHHKVLRTLSGAEIQILVAIKKDLIQYVDQACETYARFKVVRGYSSHIHNVLDAVALGLTELGRM